MVLLVDVILSSVSVQLLEDKGAVLNPHTLTERPLSKHGQREWLVCIDCFYVYRWSEEEGRLFQERRDLVHHSAGCQRVCLCVCMWVCVCSMYAAHSPISKLDKLHC